MVQAKGGIKVVCNDDKLLKEVDAQAEKSLNRRLDSRQKSGPDDLKQLKHDLSDDPDTAMQKNMVVFLRKFEVQRQQIVDELMVVVDRATDRIIKEVRNGAHERILDQVSDFVFLSIRSLIVSEVYT